MTKFFIFISIHFTLVMFRVAYYISKKKQLGKKVKLKFLAEKVKKKKKSKFIQQECKPTTSIKQQSREGTEKAV